MPKYLLCKSCLFDMQSFRSNIYIVQHRYERVERSGIKLGLHVPFAVRFGQISKRATKVSATRMQPKTQLHWLKPSYACEGTQHTPAIFRLHSLSIGVCAFNSFRFFFFFVVHIFSTLHFMVLCLPFCLSRMEHMVLIRSQHERVCYHHSCIGACSFILMNNKLVIRHSNPFSFIIRSFVHFFLRISFTLFLLHFFRWRGINGTRSPNFTHPLKQLKKKHAEITLSNYRYRIF